MKRHRHTLERRNAPYRGATIQEDFVLPYTRAVRDVTRLLYVAGKEGHRGQTDGLLEGLVSGNPSSLRNSLMASGNIVRMRPAGTNQDLRDWEKVNNATTTTSGRGVLLSEGGLLDPAGVRLRVLCKPGDILWVSFFVKRVSGDARHFKYGAWRINGGQKDLEPLNLQEENDGVWVDKRLYCREREEVELALMLHDEPSELAACSLLIEDFAWGFAEETPVNLDGIEHGIKNEARRASERIQSMEGGR